MKIIRFLKKTLGLCQAKGCWEQYAFCADIKCGGKKIESAKLCEKHTLMIVEAQAGEVEHG